MNELFEDVAIVLVIAAAVIMTFMILIVIGTIMLNVSLSWGWLALVAGFALAIWGVLKIPVPLGTGAPPHQDH